MINTSINKHMPFKYVRARNVNKNVSTADTYSNEYEIINNPQTPAELLRKLKEKMHMQKNEYITPDMQIRIDKLEQDIIRRLVPKGNSQ